MKREPAEPQGFIKPTGVGIPHLQAGEEVNHDVRPRVYQPWGSSQTIWLLVGALIMESEFYQLVFQFVCFLGEVEYFHCASLVVLPCVVSMTHATSPLRVLPLICN